MSGHSAVTKARMRALGVIFIALLVGGVWLVNAVFTHKFDDYSTVHLRTDAAGLQLPVRADVKVRGVIVGAVINSKADSQGVDLTLGLDPGKIGGIPDNVTASILPKTLFGEKYVEFNVPSPASSTGLKAGDRIPQTVLPIELEKLLNDIYPLLEAVEPAQLSFTLNALATALDGRGDQLGQTITTLHDYLGKLNPQLPALMQDITQLASVSQTYAQALPELAATLRNTVTTGQTFIDKSAQITQFLREFTAFSTTAKGFLDTNGSNLVQLSQVSAPVLDVLARFAPEYPCLLEGMLKQIPLSSSAFRGHMLHIDLLTLPLQPRGYTPGDRPVYGADGLGPNCAGLPNPPGDAAHPYQAPNFRDGVDDFGGTLGRGDNQRVAPFGEVASSASDASRLGATISPLAGTDAGASDGITAILFSPLAGGAS